MSRLSACRWRRLSVLLFPAVLLFAVAGLSRAEVSAFDDAGHKISLHSPARRIISLAPHTTELLFAAGAGPHLVAVSDYSDFPPAARKLPSVGGATTPDMEKIIRLRPDLIVAWKSGSSSALAKKLRGLGISVFESEPRDFADIPSNIERLAKLAGSEAIGAAAASTFRQRLQSLRHTYENRPKLRVFYQIWQEPLMTVNGKHLLSQALRLCGGENIFADLSQLVVTVSAEAVVQANPEVIFASEGADGTHGNWRRFGKMTAAARNNLFSIDSNLIARSGPRVLDGVQILCEDLELARKKRQP